MNAPDEHGLAVGAERVLFDGLAEGIHAHFEEQFGAVFMGMTEADGQMAWLWVVDRRVVWRPWTQSAMSIAPHHAWEGALVHDPAHAQWRRLTPSAEERSLLVFHDEVEARRAQGDRVDLPRDITTTLAFDGPDPRKDFAQQAPALGLSVSDLGQGSAEHPFALALAMHGSLEELLVLRLTILDELLASTGGRWLGWAGERVDSPTVTDPDPDPDGVFVPDLRAATGMVEYTHRLGFRTPHDRDACGTALEQLAFQIEPTAGPPADLATVGMSWTLLARRVDRVPELPTVVAHLRDLARGHGGAWIAWDRLDAVAPEAHLRATGPLDATLARHLDGVDGVVHRSRTDADKPPPARAPPRRRWSLLVPGLGQRLMGRSGAAWGFVAATAVAILGAHAALLLHPRAWMVPLLVLLGASAIDAVRGPIAKAPRKPISAALTHLIALALVTPAAIALAQRAVVSPTRIVSIGMRPQIPIGQVVPVRVGLLARDPRPGDVVSFLGPAGLQVGRVLALPGDTMSIDAHGEATRNGRPLREEDEGEGGWEALGDQRWVVTVPDGAEVTPTRLTLHSGQLLIALDERAEGSAHAIERTQVRGVVW